MSPNILQSAREFCSEAMHCQTPMVNYGELSLNTLLAEWVDGWYIWVWGIAEQLWGSSMAQPSLLCALSLSKVYNILNTSCLTMVVNHASRLYGWQRPSGLSVCHSNPDWNISIIYRTWVQTFMVPRREIPLTLTIRRLFQWDVLTAIISVAIKCVQTFMARSEDEY